MDFITCDYTHSYADPRLSQANALHDRLFGLLVEQLEYLYGSRHSLHVITNKRSGKEGRVVYHRLDLEGNHYDKLLSLKLLDGPAFYTDCDMLFLCPLSYEGAGQINLFTPIDVTGMEHTPEMRSYPHYSAALMWVGRPSQALYDKVAAHRDRFRLPYGWGTCRYVNDEYPLAYAAHLESWKFFVTGIHNVPRGKLSGRPADWREGGIQCVHYVGESKPLLFEDYHEARRLH